MKYFYLVLVGVLFSCESFRNNEEQASIKPEHFHPDLKYDTVTYVHQFPPQGARCYTVDIEDPQGYCELLRFFKDGTLLIAQIECGSGNFSFFTRDWYEQNQSASNINLVNYTVKDDLVTFSIDNDKVPRIDYELTIGRDACVTNSVEVKEGGDMVPQDFPRVYMPTVRQP